MPCRVSCALHGQRSKVKSPESGTSGCIPLVYIGSGPDARRGVSEPMGTIREACFLTCRNTWACSAGRIRPHPQSIAGRLHPAFGCPPAKTSPVVPLPWRPPSASASGLCTQKGKTTDSKATIGLPRRGPNPRY